MEKLINTLLHFSDLQAYAAIFGILLACGLGVPIPEDITLIAAGYLAHLGNISFWTTLLVCFLGVLIGDTIVFYLGAHYGRKILKVWFFRKMIPEERLDVVRQRLRKYGNKLIFAARFMPGLRAAIFFTSGTLHLPFRVFIFYDGLAALLSVPLLVWFAYHYGHILDQVLKVVRKVEHGIFYCIILLVLVIIVKWYLSHRKLKRMRTE